MDPKHSDDYEAIPVHCFACAARDAEERQAHEARGSGEFGGGAFDGLRFAVSKRGEFDG